MRVESGKPLTSKVHRALGAIAHQYFVEELSVDLEIEDHAQLLAVRERLWHTTPSAVSKDDAPKP